jgi:hypothetical protein
MYNLYRDWLCPPQLVLNRYWKYLFMQQDEIRSLLVNRCKIHEKKRFFLGHFGYRHE